MNLLDPQALAPANFETLPDNRVKGFKTYEAVKSMNEEKFWERVYYYDKQARLIQTAERTPEVFIHRNALRYNFSDNIIGHVEEVFGEGIESVCKESTYNYDQQGRMLSENTHLHNTNAQITNNYTND